VKDGRRYSWIPVEFAKNSKPYPVQGATRYYVRFTDAVGQRKFAPAGTTVEEGVIALKRAEVGIQAAKAGIALVDDFKKHATRKTIADAVQLFIEEIKALDKSKGTIVQYRNAVVAFEKSCAKIYLDEVDRADVVAYIGWIKANVPRRHGDQNNTIRNRLKFLTVFFSRNGMKIPLPAREWPRGEEREPDMYSLSEVNALLAVANPDERLLIETFLYTGFRDDEVAHLEYSDFDFRNHSVNIGPKPHLGWHTKSYKPRLIRISLPPDFVQRMAKRRDASNSGLVFPNRNAAPDRHLIELVRVVAARVGWSGERVKLHRFRRTFASMYSKRFPIQTVQKLLGHQCAAGAHG
jgi:integrase